WSGTPDDEIPRDILARFAVEDIEDIDCATAVVAFTEPSHAGPARGGRHVEAGYAIGRGQTLIIVGHVENVFYALPQVIYVETWAEAKRILLDMRGPVFEIRELDAIYVPEAIGAMALHHTSEIGSHVELLIGDAMEEPDEWTSLIPGHEGWVRLRDLCDRVIADLETAPETVVL
ncbi:MAG: hypothetical protein WBA46_01470, partial [Thermomicrobiales bacterium]